MNQCILIGTIVDVLIKGSGMIHLRIAVGIESMEIFTVECTGALAKAEYFHNGDTVAIKAHLKMENDVHIIAEKIASMSEKQESRGSF